MIAVLKNGTTPEQRDSLCKWFESMGLSCHVSQGEFHTIIGLIGDVSKVDIEMLESLSIVERVTRISDPFKKANRKFHEEPSVVDVSGVKIGGGHFQIIAGPCSVESREQIIAVAKAVKASGATMLRGGAFKPRTSPYAFQGLRGEGIRLLLEAKKLKAEIIHIHAVGPALLTPVARLLGLKVVFTHHGPDYDRDKWGAAAKTVLRLGEMMGARFANEIIVISNVINDMLIRKYHRKECHLIYNGVPAPQIVDFPEYLEETGVEKGKYIFSMCRFVPEKNLHHLIEAFSKTDTKGC